jgi:peptide/nickel transport system ATP-binding protein
VANSVLVRVERLTKLFSYKKHFAGLTKYIRAIDDVSFEVRKGEIYGLAGESGCGKSTLGELLVCLQRPTSGSIFLGDQNVIEYRGRILKELRRSVQIVFQDPYQALDPKYTVLGTVLEPLNIHRIGLLDSREEKAIETLEKVGLRPASRYLAKLPCELSGGERQRLCIARASVLDPRFLVADEPVSMLDVSIRAGILELLKKLRDEAELTCLFISHDLATIGYLTDRTAIMYLGRIIEEGPTKEIIHKPLHPYSRALISAVPSPNPDVKRGEVRARGAIPDPIDLPSGCRFRTRCTYAQKECSDMEPQLENVSKEHRVACFYPLSS